MKLRIDKKVLIYNFIFFFTFAYNFLIFSKNVFSLNEVIAGVFLIICLAITLIDFKVSKEDKILFLFLFIYMFIFILIRRKINFHILFLYLLIILSQNNNKKIYGLTYYKYLGIISLTVQAIIFRFEGRIVNSMIDPNYSGYLYFIFYIFLDKLRSKWKYLILILGLLTLSRNFLLAFFIYNIFKLNILKKILKKIKFTNFFRIFFTSSLLILILGELYVYYFEMIYQGNYYLTSWKRIFNFVDYSNYYRFLSNQKMIEFFKNSNCIFGTSVEWYKENIFISLPHNLYGILIINYGIIFMIIFFYLINKCLRISTKNINIVMGLMLYYLILGHGLLGFQLLITYFILEFDTN